MCMDVAPEVFELDDDDYLQVLDDAPGEDMRAKVALAAERCPKQAISIADQ